jgi:hypothetical protein
VLAGVGDGQMLRDTTRRRVDERAIQCSHDHNEEDQDQDGHCLMMDCYDLLFFPCLVWSGLDKDTHSLYGS